MFRPFTKDIINTSYLMNTEGILPLELTTDHLEIFRTFTRDFNDTY